MFIVYFIKFFLQLSYLKTKVILAMEEIRNTAWKTLHSNQQCRRESLLSKNRNIENVEGIAKISKEDIIKMVKELKRKKIKIDLLIKLKESFFQDQTNIDTFLEMDGALEILITALSGQDARLQINAAYCLCNLSLGQKYLKILKIAGPYLLLHLEGMNSYLIEACIWTLGNLSSHHEDCVKLLKSQGCLSHLVQLLNHKDDNIITATIYALTHFVYTGFDVLASNDFENILESTVEIFKKKPSSIAYLISVLSANQKCQFKLLQERFHVESLLALISSLKENIMHSAWYIRIIGNLVAEVTGEAALQILSHKTFNLDQEASTFLIATQLVFNSGQIFLMKEFCWLLGNLLNHQNGKVSTALNEYNIFELIANQVRYFLIDQQKSNTL